MMRTIIYKITLLVIPALIMMSVYTAFLGATRAQTIFNSPPAIAYWGLMILFSFAAVFCFKKLRKPHLFLIHIGTLLVLIGSLLASDKGQEISGKIHKQPKLSQGQMIIYENQSSDELYERSKRLSYKLPFKIRLNDFIYESYPPYLIINFPNGRMEQMPAELGQEQTFNNSITKVRIIKVYNNFKITLENGHRIPIDSQQPGKNPAVELEITKANGTVYKHLVFERFKGHSKLEDGVRISYHRPTKDFISKVDIIKNGKVVKSATIEVNHPLHYGGYHFYQYSYDEKMHHYTVLNVVSDTGINIVFAGYAAICFGVIWFLWFIKLR